MRVLSYSVFDDIGGAGYLMADAFNRERPDWVYEAVRGAPSYLQYPEHTPWWWDNILTAWRNADAVHLHDGFHNLPSGPRPGMVVTYHGTGFREVPDVFLAKQREYGAIGLVSTLDLWLLRPDDVEWNPIGMDLEALATYRRPHGGSLVIGHCPTARELKGTHALIDAVEALRHSGAEIDLHIIEGVDWETCLKFKGQFDVYFDQLAYGYGNNSIESWAMGIPTINGASDAVLEEYRRRFGVLPFVQADPTVASIAAAIEKLLDPLNRAAYADLGRQHAQRFHSQRALVERLAPFYERAAS